MRFLCMLFSCCTIGTYKRFETPTVNDLILPGASSII